CQNTWTSERYGYINNLYIVPEKRGQKLGESLLGFSNEWFKSRRVSKLRLTVTASNQAACRLYEKGGYQVTRWEMEKEI
ncbi:MAG: GNAT family N-acetyltransferase, partial [Armatimonadetes bacterium]|nr:GNAT family N-acetyltransferase [Armatimonadota bacterium]